MHSKNFGFIKQFDLTVEIECFSKKCAPKGASAGYKFIWTKSLQWKNGQGCRPDCFDIHAGNDCCYSNELYLRNDIFGNIKCPQCGCELSIEI